MLMNMNNNGFTVSESLNRGDIGSLSGNEFNNLMLFNSQQVNHINLEEIHYSIVKGI